MSGNKMSAIGSIVFAVIFLIVGILAYSNGYILLLFRFIPLSGPVFVVIAVLLFALGFYQLATAGKKDKAVEENFKATAAAAQQAAAEVAGSSNLTGLATTCTVNVRHAKGILGAVNHLNVMLNGHEVGQLKNKKSMSLGTNVAENSLSVLVSNTGQMATCNFAAISGGTVNLEITISFGGISVSQV
jgi:hypothetical protein